MARVSTYANDPARLSAGLVVRQLQLVLGSGVRYVDGGWQTLVDGLARAAAAAGVEVRTKAPARALEPSAAGVTVRLDGGAIETDVVVLAVSPDEAHDLLPADAELARCSQGRAPVRAACNDLALSRLPRPAARCALGNDRPRNI
jgi:phytoene dehydrogenase-like protein